jgi:hypothetical protein
MDGTPPSAGAGATTTPSASKTPSEEEEVVPHVNVEVPEIKEDENGWARFHKFMENFVGHMETHVWPRDADADVYPTMLPFLYVPPGGEQNERFLKELLYLLTIGMQGQGFGWKYKMLFDLHWNATRGGYVPELTSIRRLAPLEKLNPPASEVTLKPE